MKKHFSALALAIIFLIAIPLLTVKSNKEAKTEVKHNSSDEIKSEYLTTALAYEFKDEYCDEALKAVCIILNSNYKAKVKGKTVSKADFIKKHKNGKDYYSKIEKTVEVSKHLCVTYKGKPASIPCSHVTNGYCAASQPYLQNTASPWDMINIGYKSQNEAGVSLNGINELCKRGLSAEQALGRYLKNAKITAAEKGSG